MRNLVRYVALAAAVGCSLAHGQDRWDALSAKTAGLGGLHLYGVSVYAGYSSFSGPIATLEQFVPNTLNVGSDTAYGAQWSLGWQHGRGKSIASISYNGNYGGRQRYSNLNSFGHSLAMNLNRQIRTKWTLNLS